MHRMPQALDWKLRQNIDSSTIEPRVVEAGKQ